MPKQKSPSSALQTRIERAATLACLRNMKDAEICAELDIAASTLANWKTRPEWTGAIQTLSMEAWGDALHLVKATTSKAVHALAEMLEDDDPRIRMRAASIILQNGLPASM